MARWRRFLIYITAIIVVPAALIIVLTQVITSLLEPVTSVSETFMTAIKTGKLDDAYDLLAPDLQSRISQDVFVRSFVDADLKSWSFSTRNIDEFAGFVRGTSMMRGQQYVVELEFSKIDERWLITRYLMEPQ